MKRILFAAVFFCSLAGVFIPRLETAFIGDLPTGLLQLEKKHTYYLFVPPGYVPDKSWPIIFLIGERGADPKTLIGPWVKWAEKNQFFLVAVPNLTPEKDVPYKVDEWLLEIKKEIDERFRIDRNQILLMGYESGAHYAAYLGVKYPEEFSAAALFRRAWVGPFEKLIKLDGDVRKKIAFFVAIEPNDAVYQATEAKALEFEKKGYAVRMETIRPQEEAALMERMIQWFLNDVESRTILKEKPKVTFKEKFNEAVHNFFET
jgi:predicted peptidase